MKYKIEATINVIQANVYVPQEPKPRTIYIEVPSELIVALTKAIIPQAKQMMGEHVVITGLTNIKL